VTRAREERDQSLAVGANAALLLSSFLGSSWAIAAGPATTRDGIYSEAQARDGHAVYQARCSSCHRDSLLGGVNESPPLKGGRFLNAWVGMNLRELYGRILSTMPQSDPGSLTEAETLGIVAYLLQANGFPPSDGGALTLAALSQIQVTPPN
jgi:mono/diheme cytochrome c family protein